MGHTGLRGAAARHGIGRSTPPIAWVGPSRATLWTQRRWAREPIAGGLLLLPAAKAENNLGDLATIDAPSGVPLLAAAVAGFDCSVIDEHEAGDHTLFVAQVVWARRGGADSPLTTLDLDYVYLGTGRIVKR